MSDNMQETLTAGDWLFGKVLRMGANWKTTLSGFGIALLALLNALALAPTELGDIGMIIPPAWKSKILSLSLLAAFIVRFYNAYHQKSKDVTGGTTQQTTTNNFADAGTQSLVDQTVKASIESGEKVSEPNKN